MTAIQVIKDYLEKRRVDEELEEYVDERIKVLFTNIKAGKVREDDNVFVTTTYAHGNIEE